MADAQTRTMTITQIHQQLQSAFNRRDWDTIRRHIADECVYIDHARGETARGPEEATALYRSWAEAFSDAEIPEGALFDRSEGTSISRFVGRGTQDGSLGPFPPSGRYAETPFCELLRFDQDGRVIHGEIYYDQLTMLLQLGHLPSPEG